MKKTIVGKGMIASVIVALLVTSAFVGLSANDAKAEEQNRLEAYKKLRKVIGVVEEYYVDELKIDDIVNKAIDGLLTNLDAHSSYLTESKFNSLKIQTSGEFGGIGITVGLKDGAVTIISPIDGTPGDKVGLKAGDVILKINDKSTLGMSIDDAVNLMRGKANTKIKLVIVRKNALKPLTFDITRENIRIESVKAKKIENEDFIYVRVNSFDRHVTNNVYNALNNNRKAKGVILDLRNNPGGLLNQSVELSKLFISGNGAKYNGTIVSQRGRSKGDQVEYKTGTKAPFADMPLVVLINNGSASASEIVAGALQDHRRAIVVGETSFGKGSVQVIMPLDKEEGLKLTTAKYYLPSGRTIQAVGVKPDVEVLAGAVPNPDNSFNIKEADLKKHLESELQKIDPQANIPAPKDNKNIVTKQEILNDIQLKSAIDMLKVSSKFSLK